MTDSKPPEQRGDQDHQRQRSGPEEEKKAELSTSFPPNVLWFAGGIALFALVLALILDWYIAPETSTQKKDLVQAMALIIAGVAGAGGIYFTWRGQQDARKVQAENQKRTQEQLENAQEQLRLAERAQVENQGSTREQLRNAQEQLKLTQQSQEQNQKTTQAQLENAQEELRLTRQGQITERFTRAIDQLGNEKSLEIRLGGIYALERIAKESEEDHWPIIEILTAYIRQHASWRAELYETQWERRKRYEERRKRDEEIRRKLYSRTALIPAGKSQEQTQRDEAVEKPSGEDSSGESKTAEVPTPEPEIQAIITVLRRLTRYYVQWEPAPLDLHATNLFRASLYEANLKGSNLRLANLKRADLKGADLTAADLYGAFLQAAHLEGAILEGAKLFGADLFQARLGRAHLKGADLTAADLSLAFLSGADLSGANLAGTKLEGASLHEANLEGANLYQAFLSGAFLSGADLSGASLKGADLSGASLEGFKGADLSPAKITQEQLEATRSGDQNTRLPSDLNPPAHWGVKTDEQAEED